MPKQLEPFMQFLPAEGVKIVDLSPQSGVMKDLGDRNQMGVRFAVEELNAAGGLLGSPIKVFYEDSQVKPDVATRKAIRAILDKYQIERFIQVDLVTHLERVRVRRRGTGPRA